MRPAHFFCMGWLEVALGKHVVGEGLQFGERQLLYGVLYFPYQFFTLVIVVVAQARRKSIACHNS